MRALSIDLMNFFVSRCPPINPGNPVELFTEAAKSCVGIRDGDPAIPLFQSVISRAQGQSWCEDFVQSCVAYAETISKRVSLFPATELCLASWDGFKSGIVKTPVLGDVIVWKEVGIHGHTGIILGSDTLRYQTVEGNTTDSQEIVRTGNGVYFKNRAKGGSKTFVELGFLRPFP